MPAAAVRTERTGVITVTDTHVVRGTDVQPYERPGGARLRLLDGAEYGFGDVSIITSEYPSDSVAADIKHRHPHILLRELDVRRAVTADRATSSEVQHVHSR